MALIKCIECEGVMSDQAETCPHCGAPAKLSFEKKEKKSAVPISEAKEKTEPVKPKVEKVNTTERIIEKERVVVVHAPVKKKSGAKKFFVWLFVLVILGAVGGLSYDFYMTNSGLKNRVNYEIQKERFRNNDGFVDRTIENREERVDARQTRKEARKKRRAERWN